jgi:hypothetical protein
MMSLAVVVNLIRTVNHGCIYCRKIWKSFSKHSNCCAIDGAVCKMFMTHLRNHQHVHRMKSIELINLHQLLGCFRCQLCIPHCEKRNLRETGYKCFFNEYLCSDWQKPPTSAILVLLSIQLYKFYLGMSRWRNVKHNHHKNAIYWFLTSTVGRFERNYLSSSSLKHYLSFGVKKIWIGLVVEKL